MQVAAVEHNRIEVAHEGGLALRRQQRRLVQNALDGLLPPPREVGRVELRGLGRAVTACSEEAFGLLVVDGHLFGLDKLAQLRELWRLHRRQQLCSLR
jgi:hypothetical protein